MLIDKIMRGIEKIPYPSQCINNSSTPKAVSETDTSCGGTFKPCFPQMAVGDTTDDTKGENIMLNLIEAVMFISFALVGLRCLVAFSEEYCTIDFVLGTILVFLSGVMLCLALV